MGLIINIDEALSQHATYNILKEPLHQLMKDQQEAWERQNPIDLLFSRGTLDSFQETYSSTIGFKRAFKETSDFAAAPIFNNADGFSATYRSRTFQGGFIITQQVLEDKQVGVAVDTTTQFMKRWHGDIVEYCMAAIAGGFGEAYNFGEGKDVTKLKLTTADTVSGQIDDPVKVALFSNAHTVVAGKDEDYTSDAAVTAMDTANTHKQSNLFYSPITLGGDDSAQIAKLADTIYQVISYMENLKDDNGKRAGVIGAKRIVCANDPRMKGYLNAALSAEEFGPGIGINHAKDIAVVESTPYLLDIPQCAKVNGVSQGFFIIDPAYNAENHGLELTERIPLTMNVEYKKNPYGVSYDGRQRFDVNVATWRGIAYVYIGTPAGTGWDKVGNFTKITPIDTIVKEVRVVNGDSNPVKTKTVS